MIGTLAALLLALDPAHASTFDGVPTLAQLVGRSASVVQGEVIDLQTKPCSLGFCTTYSVLVLQSWKHTAARPAPEVVDVTLPGGRLDGLTQRASGIPLWQLGAQVVLFISESGTVPWTGVLTLDGDRVLDPLHARTVPSAVDDLADHAELGPSVRSRP